jgi:hypothetical protein
MVKTDSTPLAGTLEKAGLYDSEALPGASPREECDAAPDRAVENGLIAALADRAGEVVARQGAEAVRRHITRFYSVLRLRDEHGQWATPRTAAIGARLIVGNLTLDAVNEFIDQTRRANEQNRYLMAFAEALQDEPLGAVIERLRLSESSVIPEVVGFAMALENLTAAFYSDVDLVDEVMEHWQKEGDKVSLLKGQDPGFRLKFRSVRSTLTRSREHVRSGRVPGKFGNARLRFNLLVVAAADFFSGQMANARTGYALSRYRPGNDTDARVGAGPVHLAAGGRIVETGLPLAAAWADLYQCWNLAFGARFGSFPLYVCKLLIPRVAAFRDAPQQYIWNRVNALMIYLHFAAFASCDRRRGRADDSVYYGEAWSAFAESGLHRLWGEVNYRCAVDFRRKIAAARRGRRQ